MEAVFPVALRRGIDLCSQHGLLLPVQLFLMQMRPPQSLLPTDAALLRGESAPLPCRRREAFGTFEGTAARVSALGDPGQQPSQVCFIGTGKPELRTPVLTLILLMIVLTPVLTPVL